MSTQDTFRTLVYAYDIFKAGASIDLTQEQKDLVITEEMVSTQMPDLEHRSVQLALSFMRYFFTQKNPTATEDDFRAQLDVSVLANSAASVKKQMQETVTLADLQEYVRVQSLNLTRVNKDRQIQD